MSTQSNTTASSDDEPIVRTAVTCRLCGSPADRYGNRFQCTAQPGHMADLITGIFSDLTLPTSREDEHLRTVIATVLGRKPSVAELDDLNLAAKLEATLNLRQWVAYSKALADVVGAGRHSIRERGVREVVCASARQRFAAFLRVHGLKRSGEETP